MQMSASETCRHNSNHLRSFVKTNQTFFSSAEAQQLEFKLAKKKASNMWT